MKVTFYLFQEAVESFEQAVNAKKTGPSGNFKEISLNADLPFEGRAFFQQNNETKPKWLKFLAPYCQIEDEHRVRNATNSFLLLIKVQERIFAVTTGFGFTGINRDMIERGFGLRVTLNAIDPKKIKCIDARNVDLVTRQKRSFVNHDSPIAEFDLDTDTDFVSLVSGQPSDEIVGRKVSGSDSLSLTGKLEFPELGEKCNVLLDYFLREDYKRNFDFIDRVREVKDKALIARLEEQLQIAFNTQDRQNFSLAYPDLEWDKVESFKVSCNGHSENLDDIDLDEVWVFLDMHDLANVELRNVRIVGLNYDDAPITASHTAYDYAVFETTLAGKTYVLSLKKWHEIAQDFYQQVQSIVNSIDIIDASGYLPTMKGGEKTTKKEAEGSYNTRAAQVDKRLHCMDQNNFTKLPGYSKVEVCDLFSNSGHFICIKKDTQSSTLSHLFAQGSVSATLFNDSLEYRQFILGDIPKDWQPPFDPDTRDNSKLTFVYAIASRSIESLADSLPFFSKINLRNHKNVIERMGFKVALCKIPYEGQIQAPAGDSGSATQGTNGGDTIGIGTS